MIKFLLMCFLLAQPVNIPLETKLMVDAGRRAGVRSIRTGTLNPAFVRACEDHVATMARYNRQGHPGWLNRWATLQRQFPRLRIAEIASESWPNQTLQQAATDAFTVSWPSSPGHWLIATRHCVFYGASMKRGSDGVVYCSMIIGY